MEPVVWGLTGKYCAGKNRAAALFAEAGCFIIDVDKLGHQALEAKKEDILRHFGEGILDDRGFIDRRTLGKRVFGRPRELKTLEAIVHPWAIEESRRLMAGHSDVPVVINAALLFPAGMHRLCSRVIWVEAPLWTRIRRARRRDHLSCRQILKRIWSQRKLSPHSWRQYVDIKVIGNPDSSSLLKEEIRNYTGKYRIAR